MRRKIAAVVIMAFLAGALGLAQIGGYDLTSGLGDRLPGEAIELADLEIEVEIDGGNAVVRLRQVFENKTDRTLEGSYYLRLPAEAVLMDFGVWDEGRFTEAVVIERARARRAYDDIVSRLVDPALVEAPEADMTDAFRVRVAPIPAYSTRRVEAAFHQWLPIRAGARHFLLPLRTGPNLAAAGARHCQVTIKVRRTGPADPITADSPTNMPITPEPAADPDPAWTYQASFEGGPVTFDRDLTLVIPQDTKKSRIEITAFRDVETERVDYSAAGGQRYRDESGFFLAEAFLALDPPAPNPAPGDTANPAPGRDLVILFDASLSMQFEKLEKAVAVLDRTLAALGPNDRFDVVIMTGAPQAWRPELQPATDQAKADAVTYVFGTMLEAGTNLEAGLVRAQELLAAGGGDRTRLVAAITDGRANRGRTAIKPLRDAARGKVSAAVDIFGIGEDLDAVLLRRLAADTGGYFIGARETEDLGLKLESFAAALADAPVRDAVLLAGASLETYLVYPDAGRAIFNQEAATWVGRYRAPGPAPVTVAGQRAGDTVTLSDTFDFPARAPDHEYVRRLWAETRVEHLLEAIRTEGEREDWVNEIIARSKEFKFPTPYTSYLVAPRAYLRPKVIRPRDPVLRVTAPPDTRSVVALFPFGEVKSLRRAPEPDRWETRFLVPSGMTDGKYYCRLVLTDRSGRKTVEDMDFIVDSRPPRVRVSLTPAKAYPGDVIEIRVDADPDTRTIRARLGGLPAVDVKWDPEARVNRGRFVAPTGWSPGEYQLRVWAEDFAHNVTTAEALLRLGVTP